MCEAKKDNSLESAKAKWDLNWEEVTKDLTAEELAQVMNSHYGAELLEVGEDGLIYMSGSY